MTNTNESETLVEEALRVFIHLGREQLDHPLDCQRFYRFVALAHEHGVGWDAHDVQRRLEGFGIAQDVARDFAEAYWHGRCALYVFQYPEKTANYGEWVRPGGTALF